MSDLVLSNNKLSFKAILLLLGLLFLFNTIVIIKFAVYSSIIFLVEIIALLLAITTFLKRKGIIIYLILIFFVQFLYLDNNFHYNFFLEVALSLPLLIILIFAWIHSLYKSNFIIPSPSKVEKLIFFFVLYSFIMAVVGWVNGGDGLQIIIEWYHLVYYAYAFIFLYFLKESEDYEFIFFSLLVIAAIISIEYIIYNFLVFDFRFVTFQSNFLPMVIGVLVSAILYGYKKLPSLLLIGIIFLGMVFTLTRSLWIVTVIVILSTLFLFSKINNKPMLKKLILVIILALSPVFLIGDRASSSKANNNVSDQIENRAESISDPGSDISFLMRVEASYYAINKFLESPIYGKGLGDFLKLKITGNSDEELFYIDNTWVYILWKGGIVGLLIFSSIYYFIFKRMYFVAQNTANKKTKLIITGLLAGLIGMVVLGMVSPHLVKYKSGIILPFLFAYTEFHYKKLTTKI